MKLKAVVQFLGDRAHYSVTQVKKGIFDAKLLRYEGSSGVTPPEAVTLVRGVRHWVGSYDEPYFVDELGQAIEERVRRGHPHGRRPGP